VESGTVVSRPSQRDYGETREFIVNHQAIFALSEEFKGLARLRPVLDPGVETAPLQGAQEAPVAGTPRLVVVKGLEEGVTFPLDPAIAREWIVGRKRDADVPLDFDPFVSSENALIEWRDGAHVVRDLPTSRNGTSHNLRLLPRGGEARLRHGDLVGVGRTLLLYWA
jgi:pSer/pThr/pTyr-binding forkhead associated (FHA) protein